MIRSVLVLVIGLLILAAGTVHAQPTVPPLVLHYPELALINGKVVTVDDGFSIRDAVAVRDGKILAVGTTADIRALVGPSTRVVDVNGRTVIPGLIDSHVHMLRAGFRWAEEVRLDDATSVEEILERVRNRAAVIRPGQWILTLGGWHESQLKERRMPTREELDRAAPRHPVFLHRVGSLEPGKLADLVVLSDDYLTVAEDRIPKIRAVMTIVGGNVVHDTGLSAPR